MATYKEALEASLLYYGGDDLSAKTFLDKYALRNLEGEYLELTPDDMHHRLAKEFARVEQKYLNPRSEEEIYQSLKDFQYIVPQGSPMAVVGNPYQTMSASSCVVVEAPADSIHSIMDTGKSLAQLYKRRCGTGLSLSLLRPEGASVNNSARTTTGAWSFADFFSNVCRMIGQNGRRGALMETLDVRHPDIFNFISMKHDRTRVTGANISVQVVDEFMEAVEKDTEFVLRWPVDSSVPTVVKTVRARDLWHALAAAACIDAEPGVLFWDTICRELPSDYYPGFKTQATNPCSELPLNPNGSCILTAVNLYGFVRNKFEPDAWFDFECFREQVRLAQRLSDDLIDLELGYIDNIISLADSPDEVELWKKLRDIGERGRRTGLGNFAWADMLACLRIPYDSDAALEMVEKVGSAFRDASYEESVNLAQERGAFPIWDWEIDKQCPFIQRLPKKLKTSIKNFGRRNISNLTNAPTGSVAIVSFNRSSGIEPVFRNSYVRRKKINAGDEGTQVDFVDHMGDKWQEFNVFHRNVSDWIRKNNPDWDGVTEVPLPEFFVTAEKIDWRQGITFQGKLQKYVDHAISKTANLPKGTTAEEVGELYMMAWKEGLKGVTVYVDGTRTGVLVTSGEGTNSSGRPTAVKRTKAPKRPPVVSCDIVFPRVRGERWIILVGMLGDEPYEIFAGPAQDISIPNSVKTGFIEKVKVKGKNQYNLRYKVLGEPEVTISDISGLFDNPAYGVLCRLVSTCLRSGTLVAEIITQLSRGSGAHEFSSLGVVLKRVLKRYVADGDLVHKGTCPKCGGPLRYQDGCESCPTCSWSRCG